MAKKLKSLKLCLSHMATKLQQSWRTEKNFLTDLHSWLSLTLSLSLSPLRTWALHSSSFSSYSSFSLPSASFSPSRHCTAFALIFFLYFFFSDFSSLLFIPLFKSKSFVSLFKSKGFEHIVHIYVLCVQFFLGKRTMCWI